MVQLSYGMRPAVAIEGMEYDSSLVKERVSAAADGTVYPGRAVVRSGIAATPFQTQKCALPRAADTDDILNDSASAVTAQEVTSGGLIGTELDPPRQLTIAFSNSADWDATTMVIHGIDADGNDVSENVSIPNGGNLTRTTTNRFAQVDQIDVPAQSGTGGTFDVGFAGNYTVSALDEEILGVAVYDATEEPGGYVDGKMVPVLRKGRIWVRAEDAVTAGSQPFVRVVASGANTGLGAFRSDADSSSAIALAGCRYFTSAAAGELVVVELNLPA